MDGQGGVMLEGLGVWVSRGGGVSAYHRTE